MRGSLGVPCSVSEEARRRGKVRKALLGWWSYWPICKLKEEGIDRVEESRVEESGKRAE